MAGNGAPEGAPQALACRAAACPICLDSMSSGVVSLGCGHLFHERCLEGNNLRFCALCRTPVRPDRIKPASVTQGACTPHGTVQVNWTTRSEAATAASGAQPLPPPSPRLSDSSGSAGSLAHSPADTPETPDSPPTSPPQSLDPELRQLLERQLLEGGAGQRWTARWQRQQHSEQRQEQPSSQPKQQERWSGRQPDPGAPRAGGSCPAEPSRHVRVAKARVATDIPQTDAAALLEGITMQLEGAAGAYPDDGGRGGQAPPAAQHAQAGVGRDDKAAGKEQLQHLLQMSPNTYAFCIDVSSSMGSSRSWHPTAVSRLCFALATLACVVDSLVPVGDWVAVFAFDAELAILKHWFRKKACFDRAAFLAECTGGVRHAGLHRRGTSLCSAVHRVIVNQAAQAQRVAARSWPPPPPSAAHGDGAGAASASRSTEGSTRPTRAPACRHSFVLLTDGDADDYHASFDSASALMRCPPFAQGGFRALLMHIDSRYHRRGTWLRRLASGADAVRLPYVQLLELALPAHLNLSSIHSLGSASLLRGSGGAGGAGVAGPGSNTDVLESWMAAIQWLHQCAADNEAEEAKRAQRVLEALEEDDSMLLALLSRAFHTFARSSLSAPPSTLMSSDASM